VVPGAEVRCFADHLADADELTARLADFDVVVAMRERTPFPRDLLARLPRLRLLVTTGLRNAAIERALVEHLRAGRIAGAALDVYDVEPLPRDHPLRTLPNAVLTPHLGYVTEGNYRVFYARRPRTWQPSCRAGRFA
jgi:phosphoglycerate dehydrogenase-like enzyme